MKKCGVAGLKAPITNKVQEPLGTKELTFAIIGGDGNQHRYERATGRRTARMPTAQNDI